MPKKNSRSGGKFCGSHTTIIDAAEGLIDTANSQPEVYKISLGFIKAGLHSMNGNRRVKIIDVDGGVLVSVRGNTTHQEATIYTHNNQSTKLAIARAARNVGISISFGNLVS